MRDDERVERCCREFDHFVFPAFYANRNPGKGECEILRPIGRGAQPCEISVRDLSGELMGLG